jgi:hypothetical protein
MSVPFDHMILIDIFRQNLITGDAVDNDGVLDKESTSYSDIFDAFRLALKFYRYEERYD